VNQLQYYMCSSVSSVTMPSQNTPLSICCQRLARQPTVTDFNDFQWGWSTRSCHLKLVSQLPSKLLVSFKAKLLVHISCGVSTYSIIFPFLNIFRPTFHVYLVVPRYFPFISHACSPIISAWHRHQVESLKASEQFGSYTEDAKVQELHGESTWKG